MSGRNILLSLVLALSAPALARAGEPQLSDMILDGDEYFSLTLEQKVTYLKFQLHMMVTLEDLQDLPGADKHAALDLLWSTAYADSSLTGQSCVNAFNEGQWTVSQRTGRLYCKVAESIDCGGGQIECAKSLQEQVPGLGRVCVKDPGANAHPGRTAACVDKLSSMAGASLNARLEGKALADGKDPAAYHEKAKKLRAALQPFSTQMASNCRNGVQTEECGKMRELRDAFVTTTVLKQDAYKDGVKFKPTAEQKKALQATYKPAAGETAVIADPNETANPSPNKTHGKGPKAPKVDTSYLNDSASATKVEAIPEDKSPETKPALKAKTKSSKHKKEKGGSCESRYHAQLGALSCVACGLEDAASADTNSGDGVGNWISLLGVSAQAFYGSYNTQDENSRRALQQRVMEMVASYGYCTNEQYPIDTNSVPSRDWIDGRKAAPHAGLILPSASEREFANAYGFGNRMAFAAELFDDSNRETGWDRGNVQQRQWRFRSRLQAAAKGNSKFSACAAKLEDRLDLSSTFKVCSSKRGGNAKKIDDLGPNQKLYSAMAKACGLPSKREFKSMECDNQCWGSYVYSSQDTQMKNCRGGSGGGHGGHHDPPGPPGKGGEPSTPRGGKGSEPSTSRPGTYGGDHAAAPSGLQGGRNGTNNNSGGNSDHGGGGSSR
jgi:hypothetical protein